MLPDHILKAIDEYVPQLGNWLDLGRAYEMAELILETKPQVVVEIGSFKGQSLITQAFALRENNDGAKIYAIDPWKSEYATEGETDAANDEWWATKVDLNRIHQDCMKMVWDHYLDPWVVVIRAASQYVYQLFPNNIDQIYIDGSHSEIASCRDVTNYVPRVKAGGYVLFDDAGWPTTQKALGLISTMCDLVKDGSCYRIYRKR